jgi:multiple sugar transport system substrate-binding protein
LPLRRSRPALLLLAVLAASACSRVGAAPGPVAGGSQRTLTVMLADDWASSAPVVAAVGDFEEEHDVRVVIRPAKFGTLEEFMIADREGPRDVDVSQWHAFAAGALGWSVPVTERFASEYPDDLFVPGAMEDVTWDGEIHGVPLDVNAMVMIVNTDLLGRLGHDVEDLRTWEGARAVAADAEASGYALTHVPASTWSLFGWLRSNGARWFDRSAGAGTTFRFDDPAVVETMRYLADLTNPDDGTRGAIPSEAKDSSDEAYPLFVDGQIVALATGTWDVARLIDDDPGMSWTVVPMPQGPSGDGPGTVLGGSSLYVTEQADDKALAWAFATHLVRPEYALQYAREDGRLPGRTDVLGDPFFDDVRYEVAVDALPHASAMQLVVYPRVMDVATESVFRVLHHQVEDVDAEMRRLQEVATTMLTTLEGTP